MDTVTIVHGLFTVPKSQVYPFRRTPEIMDWFASIGYGFHGLLDAKEPYAGISYTREQEKIFDFTNCSIASDALSKGKTLDPTYYFDITSLIEAYLASLHSEYEYW